MTGSYFFWRQLLCVPFVFLTYVVCGQNNTQIRGFVDVNTTFSNKKVSFGLGEQDLFITSDVSDRLSFLGESVFKYDPESHTEFSVSVERVILKYNYLGNHNILVGKHHTPLNYWNDTYHHGRVFFPTIDRPLLFSSRLFPIHTTGISLQGINLGAARFGYDIMFGNGLGSSEIADNDQHKSVTLAMHVKPVDRWRFGLTYHHDVISPGAVLHNGNKIPWKVNVNLVTASVSSFGKKTELLAESMMGVTNTDSTGSKNSISSYLYFGQKITDKIIPYFRVDNVHFQNGEIGFQKNNATSIVAGMRYQVNFLAVIKLEYQHADTDLNESTNKISAQFAIGF